MNFAHNKYPSEKIWNKNVREFDYLVNNSGETTHVDTFNIDICNSIFEVNVYGIINYKKLIEMVLNGSKEKEGRRKNTHSASKMIANSYAN